MCSPLRALEQVQCQVKSVQTEGVLKYPNMSDRDRASTASPSLMEAGLKTLIGGRDSNYPLISGINGELWKQLPEINMPRLDVEFIQCSPK